uniref:NPHP5 n=1 Tax=Schmidtea mediterranea TaxID=79327 RepID=A0A0H3YFP4_SCHMD|nr:NPHP5 [Schmidtea mediterranea]
MNDDEFVIEVAKKILASNDSNYSKILIDLNRYLESIEDGQEAIKAFETIWKRNLLPIMLLEIKKDFTNIEPKSWKDGFCIVQSIYDILSRIVPQNRSEENEIQNRFIPEFIENLMCFLRQMQGNFNESLVPEYRGILNSVELLKEIKQILELSESFLVRFSDYVSTMIESPWFLQLFITDNDKISILMTEWLMKLIKINPSGLKKISKSTVNGIGNIVSTIFDEIIYHLASTDNKQLIEININCLLTMFEADQSLVSVIHLRYKGLKLLILKWSMSQNSTLKVGFSNLFSQNFRLLLTMLDSDLIYQAGMSTNLWAIIKIQSWWRSVAVRLKLAKTNKAFERFQRNYRSRKLKEIKEQNTLRIRKELEHQISITRQRKFRSKLEAEVLLMETLPAPIVFKHLEKTKQEAATTIQSIWRGHQERRQLIMRQQLYRKSKAAIRIQRCVRAWLSKRDLIQIYHEGDEKSEFKYWDVPGLNMERKSELNKVHNKWMASHKHEFRGISEDTQLELHHKAQKLYHRHLYELKTNRRKDIDRELTLARLETDSKLLISAPDLAEAVDGFNNQSDLKFKIDNFHCKIRPIANRAAQLHQQKINTIKQPWWKQLLVEEPIDLEADDDLLLEPVDLDQYMILRNRLEFLKDSEMAYY